ncbi:hypothetical protein EUC41_03735 [Achromobacter denitrificans]|uniref:Helix-turn-helix domain-containing protein n=1 Tax=Achromobacter denitrificans TaxID=32002 RepID=A0ABZ3GC87_ACHDE|nr:hypothetical protein [Achromobacter denitrificans]MDX3878349.1 hypothetical protein [Achromobacter sp.]ASC67723.1 hypothetical protein B9P52_27195 [Achromobacter denitrificans]MBV2158490.1 hypothetical protein [Achromobacter denitrificans]MDF3860987.1 hypothetical protein [Achromobacter denitrificans]MPT38739.1 hypothetical protein [Achromobacter sp.]
MTLPYRPGFLAAAVLALYALMAPSAEAACADKKILAMAKDGRSVQSIAKACNMPAAKVRGVIDGDDADKAPPPSSRAAPSSSATSSSPSSAPPASAAARNDRAERKDKTAKGELFDSPDISRKLPSGAGLVLCDCQGSVPYGEKAPELRCQSGTSIATPCAGYCPPTGIAPWRRICS